MTASTATIGAPAAPLAWLRAWQQRLSDRVHTGGDQVARQHSWAVTVVTGRAGFGGRIYRDPRFDQLAAAHRPPAPPGGDR